LALVPDTIVAGVINHFIDGGILGFFGVWVGLQALYLAIWVKNSLWNWFVFSGCNDRKRLADHMFNFFRENNFPVPQDHISSPAEYFESVCVDEKVPVKVRLQAARELGVLQYLESTFQMQTSARVCMSTEDALLKWYAQRPTPAPAEVGA
jgi:hypothetical protein